jgi:hypothetical protein
MDVEIHDASVQANNTSVHKVDSSYSTVFTVNTRITTLWAHDKNENLAPSRITF